MLGLSTFDGLEICGIIASDCTAKLSLFVDVVTDTSRYVSEISDAAETTTQVTPNWLDLGNTEQYWVHESEDIESHHLSRECADSLCLNFLSNHIGLVHKTVPQVELSDDSESHIRLW
jgi:hypothetical protein